MESRIGQQCGNYRLTHLLGQGGFADVYLGEHVYLKTYAALKILRMQLTNDVKEDFLREAQTVASLEHPHIVRILECGFEGQVPFLVMTYAPNGSLRQRYPKGSRLPLELVVSYVQQVGSALHYAHAQRMIHRDIKPENMLLGFANDLLLSDFGVVSFVQSTSSQTTKDMAGTIPYMAPEQLRGRPQPASDQYALGIVVYEWLSGMRPFQGSFAEVASQHLLALPPPLYGNVPGVSPEIERVVFTALAKEPEQRFVSVQAFASALEQACQAASPRSFTAGSVLTSTEWRPPAHGLQLPSRSQLSVNVFSSGGHSSAYLPQSTTAFASSHSRPLTGEPFAGNPSVAQPFPSASPLVTTQQNPVQTQQVQVSRNGMNTPVTWLLLAACVGSVLVLLGSYVSKTLILSNMWTFLTVAVVALASLLIRVRVNRFSVFMKRIEAFPEAERVKAMRTELNVVTPPEMTAEQFIKFKQHPYNFAFKSLVVVLYSLPDCSVLCCLILASIDSISLLFLPMQRTSLR